ncbi:hypothetical protein [Natronospira proteinivora]|uniref:hypothetical protein n=1 Tax=Natronospira proteinivora TaxID=1807133 RepID=UPI00209F7536
MTAHQSNSPQESAPSVLTLDLSGSLESSRLLVEDLAQQAPHWPAFARVLSRGEWLAPGPSIPQIPSPAPLALLGEGEDPADAFWLRADPVHLRPDQDFLLLWDASALDLSDEEARQLAETFNGHFQADGFLLKTPAPGRWYLRCASTIEGETTPVDEVTGRNIAHFMPRGKDCQRLAQLMNETQMLFHEHPVNQARAASGQWTVSGVWPWGGGRLPPAEPHDGLTIFSDDPLHRGLARWQSATAHAVPGDYDQWKLRAGQRNLVRLDQPAIPARHGDGPAWQTALADIENRWLLPALADGQSLLLNLGRLGRVRYAPSMGWRFWRRSRPLWYWLTVTLDQTSDESTQ